MSESESNWTTKIATTPSQGRLVSLDVFRGATIIAMILVNNPGTWSAEYPPRDCNHASLLYAVTWILGWLVVLSLMYRWGVILKI